MQANTQTITRLYTAFAALDVATMASCYSDQAQFDDPVFSLNGKAQVMGMWGMLCDATRAKGQDVWRLEFSDVRASDGGQTQELGQGQAHWEAHYRFSATGRLVHNRIDAQFGFNSAGLITTHRDRFDFYAWSRQALGTPGWLLGWTPVLRRKVRATAARNLQKYLAARVSA
jgi:hypothetical protein